MYTSDMTNFNWTENLAGRKADREGVEAIHGNWQ